MNAISAALTALKTKIEAEVITAIATNGLSAENNEDIYRQVLFRFAGDAGKDASHLITIFTLDILSGF